MKKLLSLIFGASIVISCKEQKSSLQEQIENNIAIHLNKIDSSATLDSIHILLNIPLTEKVGRIIDDTLSAERKNDKDSIEIYRNESNYLRTEIDSVSKSIGAGDSVKRYGYLITFAYYLTKNGKKKR